MTWMDVRRDMDEDETRNLMDGGETVHGWRWDNNIAIWMHVRQDHDRGVTHILGPVWAIDISWIDVRCKHLNLYWGEMWPGCRWFVNLGTWWGRAEHGWSWYANLQTWMGVRWDLDGAEMRILRLGCRWEGTYLGLRSTSHGLDRGDTQISTSRWVWDGTWIELRLTSWDLDRVRWD